MTMNQYFTKKAILVMMTLGMALASCTDKAPVKEPQNEQLAASEPDNALVVAADNNLKTHQEDILTLWEMELGEGKTPAKYALAKDYVVLSTDDGKDCLLLSFYKDMKDIDNFDGIAVKEGQQLAFQGDALVVKEKTDEGETTTYFEKTENEGFSQLFSVTEKDGKKSYVNDLGEPYDEKEAQGFIEKIGNATPSALADNLSSWINI